MQPSYTLISDRIAWSTDISAAKKVLFTELTNGPFGPFFLELSNLLLTQVPRQLLWHSLNNLPSTILCRCGSKRKWVKNLNNYRATCSPACAGKLHSEQTIKKSKVPSDYRSNPEKLAAARERYKQTCMARYGVEHPRHDPTINAKIEATNIKKYGAASPLKNTDVANKATQTFKKRFAKGTTARETLLQKRKTTSIAKYGVEYPMQSIEIRSRFEHTMLEQYGVKHALHNAELDAKRKATNILRFGAEEAIATHVVREKIKSKNMDVYGVECANGTIMNKFAMDILHDPILFESELTNLTLNDAKDYLCVSLRTVINYAELYNLRHIFSRVKNTIPESFIAQLLDSTIGNDLYIRNSKNIIAPLELDFFIPTKKIAIEINGIYWHSEIGGNKTPSYHYNKWKRCMQQDITLLQFTDYEIMRYPELISARIRRYSNHPAVIIGARKLDISTLENYTVEQDFLNTWHIQGSTTNRNQCFAAHYNGQMVGISTWKIHEYSAELVRFATNVNYSYPGLLSKMIARFVSDNKNIKKIISYSNNNYGSGRLYKACGFHMSGFTPPGYKYTKDYVSVESRIKYQRHKLTDMFGLDHDDTRSEWHLMQEHGYDRIWDSGNTKWSKLLYQ